MFLLKFDNSIIRKGKRTLYADIHDGVTGFATLRWNRKIKLISNRVDRTVFYEL